MWLCRVSADDRADCQDSEQNGCRLCGVIPAVKSIQLFKVMAWRYLSGVLFGFICKNFNLSISGLIGSLNCNLTELLL